MTTLLCVYIVGVLINALGAASIWNDLTKEQNVERVRLWVLGGFIAASFLTWIFAICYFLIDLIKSFRKKHGKKDSQV